MLRAKTVSPSSKTKKAAAPALTAPSHSARFPESHRAAAAETAVR